MLWCFMRFPGVIAKFQICIQHAGARNTNSCMHACDQDSSFARGLPPASSSSPDASGPALPYRCKSPPRSPNAIPGAQGLTNCPSHSLSLTCSLVHYSSCGSCLNTLSASGTGLMLRLADDNDMWCSCWHAYILVVTHIASVLRQHFVASKCCLVIRACMPTRAHALTGGQ